MNLRTGVILALTAGGPAAVAAGQASQGAPATAQRPLDKMGLERKEERWQR